MTDNDIVKALECLCGIETPCKDCVGHRFPYPVCKQQVAKDARDLINRQKAENERLIDLVNELGDCNVAWVKDNHDLRVELKTAKSEAIREFVERLKAKRGLYGEIWESDIDKTVEEMTEETPS